MKINELNYRFPYCEKQITLKAFYKKLDNVGLHYALDPIKIVTSYKKKNIVYSKIEGFLSDERPKGSIAAQKTFYFCIESDSTNGEFRFLLHKISVAILDPNYIKRRRKFVFVEMPRALAAYEKYRT